MINFFIFIFFFYISIISIVGYGKIFQRVFLNNLNYDEDVTIYLGFYGIMLINTCCLYLQVFF